MSASEKHVGAESWFLVLFCLMKSLAFNPSCPFFNADKFWESHNYKARKFEREKMKKLKHRKKEKPRRSQPPPPPVQSPMMGVPTGAGFLTMNVSRIPKRRPGSLRKKQQQITTRKFQIWTLLREPKQFILRNKWHSQEKCAEAKNRTKTFTSKKIKTIIGNERSKIGC